MPSRSYMRRRSECARRRGLLGVAARRRKMLEDRSAAVEVGVVTFEGPMFGHAKHVIRLHAPHGDAPALLVTIDGVASRPRSLRGFVRLVSRRLFPVVSVTDKETRRFIIYPAQQEG